MSSVTLEGASHRLRENNPDDLTVMSSGLQWLDLGGCKFMNKSLHYKTEAWKLKDTGVYPAERV